MALEKDKLKWVYKNNTLLISVNYYKYDDSTLNHNKFYRRNKIWEQNLKNLIRKIPRKVISNVCINEPIKGVCSKISHIFFIFLLFFYIYNFVFFVRKIFTEKCTNLINQNFIILPNNVTVRFYKFYASLFFK